MTTKDYEMFRVETDATSLLILFIRLLCDVNGSKLVSAVKMALTALELKIPIVESSVESSEEQQQKVDDALIKNSWDRSQLFQYWVHN